MADLKPQLMADDEGRICMYVALGAYSTMVPIPESMAGASPQLLEAFFEKAMPEATKELMTMRKKSGLIKRRVKRG